MVLQPVVTFAYITGWRTNSEILTLQWGQVDFNATFPGFSQSKGICRLNPGKTKNDEGRVFPFGISLELTQVLENQRKLRVELKKSGVICPWVFHHPNGRRIGDYRKSWAKPAKPLDCQGKSRMISDELPSGILSGPAFLDQ